MKLTRLVLRRMPGIVDGFTIADIGPGLNVVVGPNGIGKSSAATALRALLWPATVRPDVIDVEATWVDGGRSLQTFQHTPGKTAWQENGQPVPTPPLPADRFRGCFFPSLQDLLAPSGNDRALGEEIARQLAGGFDVGALLQQGRFGPPGRPGQAEAQQYRVAERDVARLRSEQAALEEQRTGLSARSRALGRARAAAAAIGPLERAAQHVAAAAELTEALAVMASFPSGMDSLRSDDLETLAALRSVRRAAEDERAAALRIREDRERELGAGGLDAPIPATRLATAEADAGTLRDLERTLDELARRADAAQRQRGAAAGRLGDLPAPRTDHVALDHVEALLAEGVILGAERARLEAEVAAIVDEGGADPAPLREAAAALRAWLAAPGAPAVGTLRVLGHVLSGILGLLGLLLAVFVHTGWIVLCGFATVGVLAAALLDRAPPDARVEHVRRFGATGVRPPASWRRLEVEITLATIERACAVAEDARVSASRRAVLLQAQAGVYARTREHAARVVSMRAALGIDAGGTLALAVIAHTVGQLRDAEADGLAVNAERTRALVQHGEVLSRVAAVVAPTAITRAADAVAAVSDLARRSAEYRRLAQAIAEATARIVDAEARAQRGVAEERALLVRACAASEDELAARLAKLPAWSASARTVERCRGAVAEHARALAAHPALLALDLPAIAAALTEAHALAATADALAEDITRIEQDVARTCGAHSLEDALAARTSAKDALSARRGQAMFAAAGRLLLQRVAARHEAETRPQVLQRAMDWFGAFTHHAWSLGVGSDGVFHAIESETGVGRALGEQSGGTRAQLLLAVRLAFAAQEDPDQRVPFVLDETLSISDPARFDAVVESLLTLVRLEGRQVFYLTSQPVDAERWRRRSLAHAEELRVIDLGAIRRGEGSAELEELLVAPARVVAAPGQDDAVSYARRLGVPRLVPRVGPDAQHPFYLLDDDLPALYALLCMGVTTVGAARALLRSGSARLLPDRVRVAIAERLPWFDAFVEARAEGRGHPVDRQALVAAGMSPTFLEAVSSLAADLEGDGQRLVAALRQRRVQRLSNTVIDRTEQGLSASGHLDPRLVLALSDVRNRVLAVAAAGGAEVNPEEVIVRVDRWWERAEAVDSAR